MSTGTVHTVVPGLHLVEGYHAQSLWDDPDLPTVAVYRSGTTLYLFDTGAGPEQRESIRGLVRQYDGQIDRLLLLNSHGHPDHLGNNDLVSEIAGHLETRHYFPRDARSGLDFVSSFGAMYKRGMPYFDYLAGLSLKSDEMAMLLAALGADVSLTGENVIELARRVQELKVAPALGAFLPSVVVDILLQAYPPVFPSVETMTDYEDYADASQIRIGSTRWTGWTFLGDDGEIDVHVLQSGGHSPGGVIFYLPEHRFLMMADETTFVPIWADSDPRAAVSTARKALTMMDEGRLTSICGGHRPMDTVSGDDARVTLRGIVGQAKQFAACVDKALVSYPDGVGIDELYEALVRDAKPGSIIAVLKAQQFPVFSGFLKLTLLNHCLLLNLPQGTGPNGRPTFRASPALRGAPSLPVA